MSKDPAVEPQDAFSELARITLADHSLTSVMERVAALAKRTVPGADEVSVTVLDRGRPRSVAFTGQLALDLDERQYERGFGPCLDATAGGELVHVPVMGTEDRWPQWAEEAQAAGGGSLMSIPVPVQREVSAALNVYSATERAFDEHSMELGRTFAAYAGVALANMHLYEAQATVARQLQEAMQSRAVIEQAKGVVMAERRCSVDEAFAVLVKLSQDSNRKLRDVAQALVERTAGSPQD